jgi:DNA-binding response OmpR family regulator
MKPKVLVIDDEPHICHLIRHAIEDRFEVHEAYSAVDAIKCAREIEPDIITMDLMMPGMSGFEICRALKKIPSTREVPIIIISAKDEINDKIEGINVGAIDYITKPFDVNKLVEKIEENLKLSLP